MLNQISEYIKQTLEKFKEDDSIILNNVLYKIAPEHFSNFEAKTGKSITFIDGGQAEIIAAGNFCLSLIRVVGITFKNNIKKQVKKEFYLFTKAIYKEDIYFESKIFGDKLIDEADLIVSSNDQTIKTGIERASITKITAIARRLAELSLALNSDSDYVLLDGTLEKTFLNEEKYLEKIKDKVSALAKSSSLFTHSGNSPTILLNKLGPNRTWCYSLNNTTSFVKLHSKAKHVLRFEGNKDILPHLIENSSDAIFLGYPYGLILADRLARVSNEEKNSLIMTFLLKEENKEIVNYLNSSNSHEILDNLGY